MNFWNTSPFCSRSAPLGVAERHDVVAGRARAVEGFAERPGGLLSYLARWYAVSMYTKKEAERFARLRTHITALRSHASAEIGKKLSPARRKEIAINLTVAIERITRGRKL
jgi:hypothetical protein